MTTLDKRSCGNCGRLLDYKYSDDPDDWCASEPYAVFGNELGWSYWCAECGYSDDGHGDPPTFRDALDPDTVVTLEADLAAAYERGRQDERRLMMENDA